MRRRVEPGAPQPRREYPSRSGLFGDRIQQTIDQRHQLAKRIEARRPAAPAFEWSIRWRAPASEAALIDAWLAGEIACAEQAEAEYWRAEQAGYEQACADVEAELAAEFPKPIRSGSVESLRQWQFCDRCHGDIEPGEPAATETLKTDRGLATVYVCGGCQAGGDRGEPNNADRYGCKLFEESGGGPINRLSGPGMDRKRRGWKPGARGPE